MIKSVEKSEAIVIPATESHIGVIKQIIDLAERSGSPFFPLQSLFDLDAEQTEALMEALIHESGSYYCWKKFWLLQVGGEVVGGCAAWIEEAGFGGDLIVTELVADLFGFFYIEKAAHRLNLLRALSLPREPGTLQLDSIAIFPSHQGQGLVQYLLENVMAFYCRQGIRNVQIQLVGANERAFRAYQKLGFIVKQRRKGDEQLNSFYPGNEKVLMERECQSNLSFATQ
jgi:ribosomal protein S18 acetylase RimI-like enzyme